MLLKIKLKEGLVIVLCFNIFIKVRTGYIALDPLFILNLYQPDLVSHNCQQNLLIHYQMM